MPSPFAAQTMPLGQLLAGLHVIQTPPYQRSFVWEEAEAGRLLDDLVAALDDESEGTEIDDFLGTMLFIEVERPAKRKASLPFSRQPKQSRILEVVDGLQRLTTLTILFCVIRDLDDADGTKPNERLLAAIGAQSTRHRLSLREPDELFFQTHVREAGATRVEPAGAELSSAEERSSTCAIICCRPSVTSMQDNAGVWSTSCWTSASS